MGLVRLALSNFYGVVVLALFIMVLGAVAIAAIPVDILPVFKVPAVQVLTYYSGMPARAVERTLTDRIERWVNQSPGVANVESRSISGVSVVRLYFREDTDPNTAITLTSTLADATRPYLPPNTLPPVVLPFDPTGTLPLGILTVSNSSMVEQEVKDLARINVRNMLGAIPGVVAPVVIGGKDRQIMIYLDPKRLEARGLSPVDVVHALDRGNMMTSPGTAYFGDYLVSLDTNLLVRNVDELNDLPIVFEPGRQIYLRDVGQALDDAVIQKSRVRINGRQQVYVPIYRQVGASSLAVADGVRQAIPTIEANLPEGTILEFVMDQSAYVRKAIESLIHEGVVGAILVALMILIFLGNWKMTLIATLSLPLAILGAIIGLHTTGQTINVMTLGGLFVAIGPLVDNVIVVLENNHRHLSMGKAPDQAALDATGELILPVVVATLALIIVLAPVAMTPGVAGFLYRPLTLAVGLAMLASFVLSWTFVPALCAKLLGHQHKTETRPGWFTRFHHGVEGVLARIIRHYTIGLNWVLRHRGAALVTVVCLFAVSLVLLRDIGQEYFPAVDAGQISLQIRAPSYLRLDATERRIIDVEAAIAEVIPPHELSMIVSEIGLNTDWSAAYSINAGQQDTVIRLQLTPQRSHSAQEYAILLRQHLVNDPRFTDLEFSFDTGGMVSAALNFGSTSPIDIQITGGTEEHKFELARRIKELIANVPGAVDVRILQRNDAPYLILEVMREKAAAIGLSATDVIMQVVTAMNSSIALSRNFWIDPRSGNQYFVTVQYPDNPYFQLEDLQNVVVTGRNQKVQEPVRLSSLVNIRAVTQAVEYNHSGLRRVVNVQVNIENRDLGSVAADIQQRLQSLELPPGVKVELRGEYSRMREAFSSLGAGLALAFVLVYLLMVPLMRSFLLPLIIMANVPLGLIGVFIILWATHTTLNIQSGMGVIFLIGIIVSQGVLLMDFANHIRQQGRSPQEAITSAAQIRFKPILMTFLATFLDLLPLAIGLGRGSEALTPLARAVVGGLITATCLNLFMVPVLYTLLVRDGVPLQNSHSGENENSPAAAQVAGRAATI
jgi:CzcA family heavy metal efflux pump